MCILKRAPQHPTGTFEAHDSARFKEDKSRVCEVCRFGVEYINQNLLRLRCEF